MPTLIEVKRRLPSIGDVARHIKEPLKDWPGNCFYLATKICETFVPGGQPVYGHWLGPISEKSFFKNRRGLGFCRHGWIDVGDRGIVDPTRWVFEAKKPYIYIGRNKGEYDRGGNHVRFALMGPPPRPKRSDPRKAMRAVGHSLDRETIYYLRTLLDDRDVIIGLTLAQRFWVANVPPDELGRFAKPIYEWLEFHGEAAKVPFDNFKEVMGR